MPKLFDLVVLEQQVDSPGAVYSERSYSEILARADRLVISAVVSDVSGTTPTLTIGVEGSPDHRNWIPIDGGTPPLNTQPLGAGPPDVLSCRFAGDQGTFTRLKVILGGASAKARIKIHVTGRVG
jgi:hypothetical protein